MEKDPDFLSSNTLNRNTVSWSPDILEFAGFFSGSLVFEDFEMEMKTEKWNFKMEEKSLCSVLDEHGLFCARGIWHVT